MVPASLYQNLLLWNPCRTTTPSKHPQAFRLVIIRCNIWRFAFCMVDDAFLGKFHIFLRSLNSVCQCGYKQVCAGLSHVKLLLSSSPGSWKWQFINQPKFTQHRGLQIHGMWPWHKFNCCRWCILETESHSHVSLQNLSVIVYIKGLIEYQEHAPCPYTTKITSMTCGNMTCTSFQHCGLKQTNKKNS